MAKTIIEVEVDDSKFLNFKSVFDDYKKSLEDTPEAWSEANAEMGNMVQASQLLKNDAEKRLALLQAATLEETRAERAQKKTEETSRKATETRKKTDLEAIKRWKMLGSTIAETTVQLSKFAAIGLGLATGATTFGMGALAKSASASRFQSMGLGISSGAMQAADINYSSALANPTANLAAVRDVQQDLSKQKLFATAGISNAQGKSITELLPELMVAAQKMAKQTPQGQLAQVSQAYGYSDVFSPEDLMRFKSMSEAEMTAMIAKTKEDEKAFAVNNSTLKSYQDLQKQWDRFGKGIETSLIKGLEPLAPSLEGLSKAASSAFDELMKSDVLEPVIDKLAEKIKEFADYLTSKDAKEDFEDLKKWIKETGEGFKKFGEKIKPILDFLGFTTPSEGEEGEGKEGEKKEGLSGWQKAGIGAGIGLGGMALGGMAGTALAGVAGLLAPLALPAIALGGTAYGAHKLATKAYEEDTPENQEWAQKIMGNIMAFVGNDEAIAAQKQLADYAKSTEEEIKKQKPITAEQYKKADLDNQSSLINGIKNAFETAVEKLKETINGGENIPEIASTDDTTAGMKGGEKAKYAMSKFMEMGWSKEQAAGLAANLHRESGFKADIVGDKGKAYGIGQWHPDRQRNFAKVFGRDIHGSSLDDQLKFVDWEMRNTEKGAGNKLRAATNAMQAGGIVSKYYERPRDTEKEMRERGNLARGLAGSEISYSESKGKPFITGKGEKDIHGKVKVKDSYALRKPTAEQQKSVMFQDQGGLYNSNASRVTINLNNATGGSATASAVSL